MRQVLTDIREVAGAVLARMLDHDSAATGVIIEILGHIVDDAINEQPAVLRGGVLCQLLWRNLLHRGNRRRSISRRRNVVVVVLVGHRFGGSVFQQSVAEDQLKMHQAGVFLTLAVKRAAAAAAASCRCRAVVITDV